MGQTKEDILKYCIFFLIFKGNVFDFPDLFLDKHSQFLHRDRCDVKERNYTHLLWNDIKNDVKTPAKPPGCAEPSGLVKNLAWKTVCDWRILTKAVKQN